MFQFLGYRTKFPGSIWGQAWALDASLRNEVLEFGDSLVYVGF